MLNRLGFCLFAQTKFFSKIYSQNLPAQFTFATFKEKFEKKNLKKSAEEFKKEIEFLANKPTYTLGDYKQRILDSIAKLQKGFRAKLLTGQEENKAQLITQKKILNAFLEEELLKETFSSATKKEISVVSQTTLNEVNMILKNYDYMKGIHTWLRSLKERNEPLPASEEELQYFFKRDRPIKKRDVLRQKQSIMNKKKFAKRMKWGPKKKL